MFLINQKSDPRYFNNCSRLLYSSQLSCDIIYEKNVISNVSTSTNQVPEGISMFQDRKNYDWIKLYCILQYTEKNYYFVSLLFSGHRDNSWHHRDNTISNRFSTPHTVLNRFLIVNQRVSPFKITFKSFITGSAMMMDYG
jgi:hypothetical protein